MGILKSWISLFVSCCTVAFSAAQQVGRLPASYRAEHWNIEDGLSSNYYNYMLKDLNGFLWITSPGGQLF